MDPETKYQGRELERCARLFGNAGVDKLAAGRVVVFGLGGVGAMAAEALARSGVGYLPLVDHDVVGISNVNRQLHALGSTMGKAKAEVMAARICDAMPSVSVDARVDFFAPETEDSLLGDQPDWVIDAIDSLGPKVALLDACIRRGLRVITCLGAGGRMDPRAVQILPLADTMGCGLATAVRQRLRRRQDISGVVVVASSEPRVEDRTPQLPRMTGPLCRGRERVIQPSAMMVPAAFGLAAASHVVRQLSGA